jgi:hypothetical protein
MRKANHIVTDSKMLDATNALMVGKGYTGVTNPPAHTPADYAALLAKVTELEAKVDRKKRLEAGAVTDNGLKLAVSAKGAVSVYGLGRFPVTLYREQFVKLLAAGKDIAQFMADNAAALKVKATDETEADAAAA